MKENMIRRNIWNEAGKAGLALRAVSAIYLFATQYMGPDKMSVFMTMFLTCILWVSKFAGCIWLMMFFMKKFASDNPEADNRDTRRFGNITALLSALVYAAISFANIAFIAPDMFTEQMNILTQQLAPMMDSNAMAQLDKTMQNLPQITFFSNLIYCYIYGAVLSAILSRNIPPQDPFANYKPDEQ